MEFNKHIHPPYLIQRAKFAENGHGLGIDSILQFDYMGSAEFEFGALPDSLKRIRKNIAEYTQFQYSFKKHPSKLVTVFCTKEQQEYIPEILEGLARDKFMLKEYCDLKKHIIGDTKYASDF